MKYLMEDNGDDYHNYDTKELLLEGTAATAAAAHDETSAESTEIDVNEEEDLLEEEEEEEVLKELDLDTHLQRVLVCEGGHPGIGNANTAGTNARRRKSMVD